MTTFKKQAVAKMQLRRARCKRVLVILNNRLETVRLIREQVLPPIGDFDDGPTEFAIVDWMGLEVYIPLGCTVFLSQLPREPRWIQEARAKVEKELVAAFRSNIKQAVRMDRASNSSAQKAPGKRIKR